MGYSHSRGGQHDGQSNRQQQFQGQRGRQRNQGGNEMNRQYGQQGGHDDQLRDYGARSMQGGASRAQEGQWDDYENMGDRYEGGRAERGRSYQPEYREHMQEDWNDGRRGQQGIGGHDYASQRYGQQGYGQQSSMSGNRRVGSSGRDEFSQMGQGQYNRSDQGWSDDDRWSHESGERGRLSYSGDSSDFERGRYGNGGNGARSYGSSSSDMGRFSGIGPSGYKRTDERLKETACERLSEDPWIDASNIDVQVKSSEITLTGTVPDRQTKFRAEEVLERVLGVSEVVNNLRIQKPGDRSSSGSVQRSSGGFEKGSSSSTRGRDEGSKEQ